MPFPFLQKTDFDRIILLDKDYNVDKMVIQERLKLLRICHSKIPYNRDETSQAQEIKLFFKFLSLVIKYDL